jgi:hypothetical protein
MVANIELGTTGHNELWSPGNVFVGKHFADPTINFDSVVLHEH